MWMNFVPSTVWTLDLDWMNLGPRTSNEWTLDLGPRLSEPWTSIEWTLDLDWMDFGRPVATDGWHRVTLSDTKSNSSRPSRSSRWNKFCGRISPCPRIQLYLETKILTSTKFFDKKTNKKISTPYFGGYIDFLDVNRSELHLHFGIFNADFMSGISNVKEKKLRHGD